MSDSDRTTTSGIRETSAAIRRHLESHVDPAVAESVTAFADLFLSKARPEFLNERSPAVLADVCLGAYRFLSRPRVGSVAVEVLNPEVREESARAPVTVLRANVTERPFIVDTIREFLHSRDLTIENMVYPLLHVERDTEGHPVEIRSGLEGESRESLVHCEVARVGDPAVLEELQAELADGCTTWSEPRTTSLPW